MTLSPPRPDRPLPPRSPAPPSRDVARALFDEHLDLAALRRALGQPTPAAERQESGRAEPDLRPRAGASLASQPRETTSPSTRAAPQAAPGGDWKLLGAATVLGAVTGLAIVAGLSLLHLAPFGPQRPPSVELAAQDGGAARAPVTTEETSGAATAPPKAAERSEDPPSRSEASPVIDGSPPPILRAPRIPPAPVWLEPARAAVTDMSRRAQLATLRTPAEPPPAPPLVSEALVTALSAEPEPRSRPLSIAETPVALAAGPPRAVIHFHTALSTAEQRRIESTFRSAGFVVGWRAVDFPIGRDNVRFFHRSDGALAIKAKAAMATAGRPGLAQDFTHYRPPTAVGTLEVWLAG